jgi:hypothetical protein
MCVKINELLTKYKAGFDLDYDVLKKYMTKGQVRERHIAKGLRMVIYIHYKIEPDDIKSFLEKIFSGKSLESDIYDYAGVENEIRGNLLKAGGAAFVPENPKAFLPLESIRQIILAAGGVPTYPFLADDAKGEFTDFERDIEKAASILKERGIFSAEFITTRNSLETLEKYATYLYDNGFIVTFGTEHNTPAMEPILLSARNNTPLSGTLKDINYKSACVIAAHQERVRMGITGYRGDIDREAFIGEGNVLIRKVIDE